MIAPCTHEKFKKAGRDRKGQRRFKCLTCGKRWTKKHANPLGTMQIDVNTAKLALRLLAEGSSIRSAERITKLHRDTICKLLVLFGEKCKAFLDERMRGLMMTHLQFDEQWTYVFKKQSRRLR